MRGFTACNSHSVAVQIALDSYPDRVLWRKNCVKSPLEVLSAELTLPQKLSNLATQYALKVAVGKCLDSMKAKKNLQPMYEIQPGQCHMYQDGFINHLSLLLRTPITQIWRHMYRDAIINHPSLFALTHPDYAIMVSKSTHWQSMLHQGLEKTTGKSCGESPKCGVLLP